MTLVANFIRSAVEWSGGVGGRKGRKPWGIRGRVRDGDFFGGGCKVRQP